MVTKRLTFIVTCCWLLGACTTTGRTVRQKLAETPDQDSLHELMLPPFDGDEEDLAEAREARAARINGLETLYETSTNELVRANALYELAQLHHERALDLKRQAEEAHAIEMDRFLIGEIAVEPEIKLEAYRNALLQRVNVLRELASNFPKDPRLAEINWQLASTMARLGNDHCEHYFKQAAMLSKTPEAGAKVKISRADWLGFNKKWDEAINLYTEARGALKEDDPLRAYATYRLGWAHHAKGDKRKAEAAFKLAFLGVKDKDDDTLGRQLKGEAARALAALWADAGNEGEAKKFAEAQALEDFMKEYQRHVVDVWKRQGKYDQLIAYHRDQIALAPISKDVPDHRLAIAQSLVAKGDLPGMEAEIKALKEMIENQEHPWFDEHGDDEVTVARVKKIVTYLPLAAGLRLFQKALAETDKAKQKALMTTVLKTLKDQRQAATGHEQELAIRMSIIQALIALERLTEALDELDAFVALGPKAEAHLVDAAFERLRIIVRLDEETKYPALPPPGEAKKPIPLPPLKVRFAKAAEEYLKLVPQAENEVNLRYQIAADLFNYGHYDEALPLFEALGHKFPRTDQGKAAIEICLSMNLKRQNWDELARLSTDFLNNRQVKGKALRDYIKENLDWAKHQKAAMAH